MLPCTLSHKSSSRSQTRALGCVAIMGSSCHRNGLHPRSQWCVPHAPCACGKPRRIATGARPGCLTVFSSYPPSLYMLLLEYWPIKRLPMWPKAGHLLPLALGRSAHPLLCDHRLGRPAWLALVYRYRPVRQSRRKTKKDVRRCRRLAYANTRRTRALIITGGAEEQPRGTAREER